MKSVLILYDTIEGQTEKIAMSIADKLKSEGHWVKVSTPNEMTLPLDAYEAIIVGGPLHMQRYPKHLQNWVAENAKHLKKKKSAFFSVCLGILQKDDPKVQKAEMKIAKDFLRKHKWHPDILEIFAGALVYTKPAYRDWETDRKSTRLNSSHEIPSRMPSSA